MNQTVIRLVSVLLALLSLTALFTACGDDTPVVVEPVGDDNLVYITTNPEKADILTFNTIMSLYTHEFKWSTLSAHRHTTGENNTATFEVIYNNSKSAELLVEYDPATDALLRGDLVYGDKTLNILERDYPALRDMIAYVETN